MALKILPTDKASYNPFDKAVLTDADFEHMVDQGFRNITVDPQITRVAGDIWYYQEFQLPSGKADVHITDVGVYASYVTAVNDGNSATDSWLYADVTFETAYNNMVDFIMDRVRPAIAP
jgi:hypothetical protein